MADQKSLTPLRQCSLESSEFLSWPSRRVRKSYEDENESGKYLVSANDVTFVLHRLVISLAKLASSLKLLEHLLGVLLCFRRSLWVGDVRL